MIDCLEGSRGPANQGAVRGTVWTVVSLERAIDRRTLKGAATVTHEVSPVMQQGEEG
jgi:hypothetical protein